MRRRNSFALAVLAVAIVVLALPGWSQTPAEGTPANLPPARSIISGRSFVIAAGGKSILFSTQTEQKRFLDNVYRPFGFSPDSRYFLYLKSKGILPTFQLYLYDVENRTERLLTEQPVYHAAWSPASFGIAFFSMVSATEFRLQVVDSPLGDPRVFAAGRLDPDYLEWREDGARLFYTEMKPVKEDYFHSGEIAAELHEIDLETGRDELVEKEVPPDVLLTPEARNRNVQSRFRTRLMVDAEFISTTQGQTPVVKKWDRETRNYETIASGHIYAKTEEGVVIREFTKDGVSFSFADKTSGTVSQRYTFTSTWLLPFAGSADLTQGGALFSGGACDGRACNVVSHNNALGYALDWQQRPAQGMGTTRLLAVEEGTVAAVATNVACNSLNTSCQIGWDNYSPSCTNTNGGAGNYVVIAHPDGSFSFYGHMRSGTSPLVVGQGVVRGTYIGDQGHSGSTGSAGGNYNGCGDHVHFQRQTGPAVWAQSIPTDFAELACSLSCRTIYTSQNVEASNPAAVPALTVQLVPSSLFAGISSQANQVILPAPAPSGGTVLTLSSSRPDVTVPPSVTVPAGQTHATFTISAAANATAGTAVITAQEGTQTATADLSVLAVTLYSVVLSPSTVIGGARTTANEAVLTSPLTAGGTVGLSSSNTTVATVGSSAAVAPGSSFAPFSIDTFPTSGPIQSTISASYGSSVRNATVTVTVLNITAVSLVSTAPVGGTNVFGNRVYFNSAPPSNATIQLTSSNPAVASVPATVTLLQGATNVPFPITTYHVSTATPVTITATVGSSVRNTNLTVQPTTPSLLTLGSVAATGGATVTGSKVTLNGPAAPNGAVVTLSSSDTAVASVPASVTVAAGTTISPTFPITTYGVSSPTTATITATLNGVSRSANLTVNPVSLLAITLGSSSVTGGAPVGGTSRVTLSGTAGVPVTVALSSSDPAVASVPPSVEVAAGASVSPGFTITTFSVGASTPVTITAEWKGTIRTAVLTVNPTGLTSVTLGTGSAVGGATVTGSKVNLNGPAPSGGMLVALSTSNSAVATVAASVTVPAGATQVNFPITTYNVTSATPITVTASLNGVNRTATLNVNPVGLTSVALSAGSAVGGATVTGNRITVNGPAGPGGLIISLSTSNPSLASVAATVTVPAGATQVLFPVTTYHVSGTSPVTITASYNGANRSANLTLNPVSLLSVTLPSGSAVGGIQVTGTVRLNGGSPPAGIAVSLATSDPALGTVPGSVTVPSGATQVTFPITTYHVAGPTAVSITASFDGISRSVNLTLNPPTPSSISPATASVVGGSSTANTRVVLNGPAPPTGAVIALASSDSTVASVPATVTVAAGALNSGYFTITTTHVTATTTVTLTASLNGVSRTATVTVRPTTPVSVALVNGGKVTGGASLFGNRVNLNGPAAAGGGTVITLTSSNPAAATVPASIVAATGSTFQNFAITSYVVASPTEVTITATLNGVSRIAILTVNP